MLRSGRTFAHLPPVLMGNQKNHLFPIAISLVSSGVPGARGWRPDSFPARATSSFACAHKAQSPPLDLPCLLTMPLTDGLQLLPL